MSTSKKHTGNFVINILKFVDRKVISNLLLIILSVDALNHGNVFTTIGNPGKSGTFENIM